MAEKGGVPRKSFIFAVRVTASQEVPVAMILANKAKTQRLGVYSIVAPYGLKGYILVEARSIRDVEELIKDVRHVRGSVPGMVTIEEVEKFLVKQPVTIEFEVGDTVEITDGPLKGETGKVISIDRARNEVTVELSSAVAPIPVTLSAELVKLLKKRGEG